MKNNRFMIVLLSCLISGCAGCRVKETGIPAMVKITVPDTVRSIQEMADAADAMIISGTGQGEIVYFQLGEELVSSVQSDPLSFVMRSMQIAPIAHNFFTGYDLSLLNEGKIGISGEIPDAYAVTSRLTEPVKKTIPYVFMKDASKQLRLLPKEKLPLFQKAEASLYVKNSEELFYSVLNGYAPVCEKGSAAERILHEAETVLHSIRTENQSEKACYQAIYQYVISSVSYDYDTCLSPDIRGVKNRSFFLEGAMEDGLAVCDGLAKEIALLSGLMGLEVYHVGARNEESGHAYLYVRLDGTYYLSCPTSAIYEYTDKNKVKRSYHTLSYMMTGFDTNSESWGYDSDAYEEIEDLLRKTDHYDVWGNSFVTIDGQRFSMRPKRAEEAVAVLRDAAKLSETSHQAVEVELCGSYDVLKEACRRMKNEYPGMRFFSGGTFAGQRLQIYVFEGDENE